MPGAEDGSRHLSQNHGREAGSGQSRGETGVLHAHFDGDGIPPGSRNPESPARQEAHEVADKVMKDHRENNNKAVLQQSLPALVNDKPDNKTDADAGDQGEPGG